LKKSEEDVNIMGMKNKEAIFKDGRV